MLGRIRKEVLLGICPEDLKQASARADKKVRFGGIRDENYYCCFMGRDTV
jgi:hypothetical protein